MREQTRKRLLGVVYGACTVGLALVAAAWLLRDPSTPASRRLLDALVGLLLGGGWGYLMSTILSGRSRKEHSDDPARDNNS
jgi:hypothetical protein